MTNFKIDVFIIFIFTYEYKIKNIKITQDANYNQIQLNFNSIWAYCNCVFSNVGHVLKTVFENSYKKRFLRTIFENCFMMFCKTKIYLRI